MDWAIAQFNLGIALWCLGESAGGANFHSSGLVAINRAIGFFQRSIEIETAAGYYHAWATRIRAALNSQYRDDLDTS
jgi:hypothetical protein